MRINNNIMALNAHRQLSKNQAAGSKAMEKLSSGMRINRAGDDAAGLVISEKMRSQIRGLKQAIRNAQDGISLILTAEGALNETHSILQRMRELAVQAATDTNTDEDRLEIQKEVDQLATEITRIASDTEFNTQKLLNGEYAGKLFHIGSNEGQNVGLSLNDMSAVRLGVSEGAPPAGDDDDDDNGVDGITIEGQDGVFTEGTATVQGFENQEVLFDEAEQPFAVKIGDEWYALADVTTDTGSESLGVSTGTEVLTAKEGYQLAIGTTPTDTFLTEANEAFTTGAGNVVADVKVLKDDNGDVQAVWVEGEDGWYATDDVEASGTGSSLVLKDPSATPLDPQAGYSVGESSPVFATETSDTLTVDGTSFEDVTVLKDGTDVVIAVQIDGEWYDPTAVECVAGTPSLVAGEGASPLNVNFGGGPGGTPVSLSLTLGGSPAVEPSVTGTIVIGSDNIDIEFYGPAGEDFNDWEIIFKADAGSSGDVEAVASTGSQTITITLEALENYSTVKIMEMLQGLGDEYQGFRLSTEHATGEFQGSQWATIETSGTVTLTGGADETPGTEEVTITGPESSAYNGIEITFVSGALSASEVGATFSEENGLVVNLEPGESYTAAEIEAFIQGVEAGDLDFSEFTVAAGAGFSAAGSEWAGLGVLALGGGVSGAGGNGDTDPAPSIPPSPTEDVKGIDVSTQTTADAAIGKIDGAIVLVSAERSMLGAMQNRLEHTIANLGTSAENLQAAESRIRDLDMAEEIMVFTKNTILQQAATSMLAQANMAPQSVLQLLG